MIIHTTAGPVAGTTDPNGQCFKGVPYAAPPVGADRFRPPRAPEPWTGPRDATAYGPAAAQPVDHLLVAMFGQPVFPVDEDCLTLNVWTPDTEGRRPVMVWLHGGGFMTGSGRDPVFDGSRLTARGDVVVVTVNYRLGAFGFLHVAELLGAEYAGAGNLGLLDQAAALAWVRDNIAAFGGDPGNVTVFGQSAGAMSVAALMAMPAAAGLFHKAVIQSGNGEFVHDPEQATDVARRILKELGTDDPQALLDVPAAELIRAQETVAAAAFAENPAGGPPFRPVVDGTVLAATPLAAFRAGTAARVPLVIGAMWEESRLGLLAGPPAPLDDATVGMMFAAAYQDPDTALSAFRAAEPDTTAAGLGLALGSERMFRAPVYDLAEAHAGHGNATWVYLFAWRSTALDGELGACHSLDLPFVFDNLALPGVEQFTGPTPPQAVADAVSTAWTRFAHAGDPGDTWPGFTAATRTAMVFDEESRATEHPLAALHMLPTNN
ncbi:carboxylesterase/lipase family protein [Yinghuangia seranimata]|uniref:carboxylesterase/lipase family protein n=1 Tax=Yinghuangia seranimata TaxID=408067 RepID=UPI00248C5C5B|nr:carboxylesterase family protein [Yinghuangia seranimata]MDI2127057.1 carboxylesterase family protein [Yinghuangia seranimata]